jgi:hypothetical protein
VNIQLYSLKLPAWVDLKIEEGERERGREGENYMYMYMDAT